MSKLARAVPGAALLAMMALLAGCGAGSSAGSSTVSQLLFKSAGIPGAALPSRYTCDGQNISPPLEWGSVPANTGELAVFLLAFTPESTTHTLRVSVEWAVAGVNPKLHKIAAGELPPGAFTGVVSHSRTRYSLCPKKGQSQKYQFEVYGLPKSASISRKFAGLPVLSALGHSPSPVNAHGAFAVVYRRR